MNYYCLLDEKSTRYKVSKEINYLLDNCEFKYKFKIYSIDEKNIICENDILYIDSSDIKIFKEIQPSEYINDIKNQYTSLLYSVMYPDFKNTLKANIRSETVSLWLSNWGEDKNYFKLEEIVNSDNIIDLTQYYDVNDLIEYVTDSKIALDLANIFPEKRKFLIKYIKENEIFAWLDKWPSDVSFFNKINVTNENLIKIFNKHPNSIPYLLNENVNLTELLPNVKDCEILIASNVKNSKQAYQYAVHNQSNRLFVIDKIVDLEYIVKWSIKWPIDTDRFKIDVTEGYILLKKEYSEEVLYDGNGITFSTNLKYLVNSNKNSLDKIYKIKAYGQLEHLNIVTWDNLCIVLGGNNVKAHCIQILYKIPLMEIWQCIDKQHIAYEFIEKNEKFDYLATSLKGKYAIKIVEKYPHLKNNIFRNINDSKTALEWALKYPISRYDLIHLIDNSKDAYEWLIKYSDDVGKLSHLLNIKDAYNLCVLSIDEYCDLWYKMEDRYAYYLALKYPNFRHKLTNKIKTEVVAFLWLKKWPQDHVNSELMDLIQEVYYAHKLYCIHFNTPIADKIYDKILSKFPKLVSLVERI